MSGLEEKKKIARKQKKITQSRLRNIALYYLERFESSKQNLRNVLQRRIDKYAYENPEYDKKEAYLWVEELVEDFEKSNYINDGRYAELQVRRYVRTGKSLRYIQGKLFEKGISLDVASKVIDESEYDAKSVALEFARKNKLGKYNPDEEKRIENRQKEFAKMMRAGFDYSVVSEIMDIDEEF